jgi:penicillin-binding protein 2
MAYKKLTLKNHHREAGLFRRRLFIIGLIITLLFGGLLSRVFYLQVIQHHKYATLSQQNQMNILPIAPKRGLIYDRNGVLLAKNEPVFSLDITRSKVDHLHKTLQRLQAILPISEAELKAFHKEAKQKRLFEPVPLKINLSPQEVAKFTVEKWQFPGVNIHARLIRNYPLANTTAHVVGFMGRIDNQEVRQINATNYSATNYIGKTGIEKAFEKQLHGQVGYKQEETDASGEPIRTLNKTPAQPGDNLHLTIDSQLQRVAKQAFGSVSGALVAIQPSTGAILALVSQPSFDPNVFIKGISQKKYQKLAQAQSKPLYNRTLRGLYAPGSIIKPFYALEGLNSGVITPETTYYDPGYFKYGNHVYKNWLRSGFGKVDLKKALIVSDDTYFYNLAVDLNINHIDKVLHEFGFGKLTHIHMPGENPGTVPTPKWKRYHLGHPWYTGDTINTGIGQGYLLATPLQMAQALATLAERGKQYQPYLVDYLTTPQKQTIRFQPHLKNTLHMPEKAWKTVLNAMQGVIKDKSGTGFRFGRHPAYSVAAKTGTAQVYTIHDDSQFNKEDLPKKYRDNALFLAFAPVDHPKIAVAVVAEHGKIAPNIARKVMDYYLLTEGKLQEKN